MINPQYRNHYHLLFNNVCVANRAHPSRVEKVVITQWWDLRHRMRAVWVRTLYKWLYD